MPPTYANNFAMLETKTGSHLDGGGGLFRRNYGSRPELVIGDGLHIERLRQEPPKLFIDTQLVPRQPGKRDVHPSVRLGIPAGSLANERLRCMEGGKVSVAGGILHDTGGDDDPGAGQAFPRLVEVRLRLRRHRSMPSQRISRISGVRSS